MTVRRCILIAMILCSGTVGVVPPAAAQSNVQPQDLAHGPYTPPPCVTGVPFADVTCSTFYDAWIEQFAADGITAGCGGGNYCPDEPVTRAQMAVFVEAAMRGTANWPPHTQLVWAVKGPDGSPDPVASGTALLAAVAAIPTSGNDVPSVTNPWLIKVGPGIYDLGSGSLTLPAYTALEGSGRDVTVITATGHVDDTHGTVIAADHCQLRNLTALNSGNDLIAVAAYVVADSSGVRFDEVTIEATQQSGIASVSYGILTGSNTSLALHECIVSAHGGQDNFGVGVLESADTTVLEEVTVTVYGSPQNGSATGFGSFGGTSLILDSRFDVRDGFQPIGISVTSGFLALENTTVATTSSGKALLLDGAGASLHADDISSGGTGILTTGAGTTEIVGCKIDAVTWLANGSGYGVNVGASKLVGTTNNNGGTVTCFGNYTNSGFFANTCP